MKRLRGSVGRLVIITATLLGSLAGVAHADPIALDYHAKVEGCPAADRFGDEVAAKLGFVPWDPQAPVALRVRIDHDSGDFVGSIEQPDGTSKILRAATCAKLDELLVSTIAVVLDKTAAPAMPAPPPDERRLRRLEGPGSAPGGLITLHFRSKGNTNLAISRVEAATTTALQTNYGTFSSTAVTLEPLCKAPCDAQVRPGEHAFVARDLDTSYSAAAAATVRVNSTIELDYKSHASQRRSRIHRRVGGTLIGVALGAIASALVIEHYATSDKGLLHGTIDPLAGLTGGYIGLGVGWLISPSDLQDETTIAVRPGISEQ